MTPLSELWERYIAERPLYEAVADSVKRRLEEELRARGLICEVQARAKDVDQFAKKILRKQYTDYAQVGDKAGARVIARYYSQVEEVRGAIEAAYETTNVEDKRAALAYDRLGYLGVHLDVLVPGEAIGQLESTSWPCEIQIQTAAEHVWADASHDLLYKQEFEPPTELQRSLYRLVALVELFDDQLVQSRETMMGLQGFRVANMVSDLEAVYYQLTPRVYDKELSKEAAARLMTLYTDEEQASFRSLIEEFVAVNRPKLEGIFRDYADDVRANPLLFQPEVISVFERMTSDPYKLRETWMEFLPTDLLQDLGTVWGVKV